MSLFALHVWIIFLTVGVRKGLVDLHSSRRLLSQSTRVSAPSATATIFWKLTALGREVTHGVKRPCPRTAVNQSAQHRRTYCGTDVQPQSSLRHQFNVDACRPHTLILSVGQLNVGRAHPRRLHSKLTRGISQICCSRSLSELTVQMVRGAWKIFYAKHQSLAKRAH